MGYTKIRRGAGRLFDDNLNRMLMELFDMSRYELDLALGEIEGVSEDTKFGVVQLLDSLDAAADVWDWASDDLSGASTKTFPSSAATLYIASDSAADTGLQWNVEVIAADGTRSYVDVTLDGTNATTPVSLGVSGIDANRMQLVGDGQSHAGNIYVQQGSGFTAGVPNTAADVLAFVRSGDGQTQQAIYTVPAGFRCRLKGVVISLSRSSGAAGSGVVKLLVKAPGESEVTKREWFLQNGQWFEDISGIVVSGGGTIRLMAQGVSDNDTNITGEFSFDLVEDA